MLCPYFRTGSEVQQPAVGAQQCCAPTHVPEANQKRYIAEHFCKNWDVPANSGLKCGDILASEVQVSPCKYKNYSS